MNPLHWAQHPSAGQPTAIPPLSAYEVDAEPHGLHTTPQLRNMGSPPMQDDPTYKPSFQAWIPPPRRCASRQHLFPELVLLTPELPRNIRVKVKVFYKDPMDVPFAETLQNRDFGKPKMNVTFGNDGPGDWRALNPASLYPDCQGMALLPMHPLIVPPFAEPLTFRVYIEVWRGLSDATHDWFEFQKAFQFHFEVTGVKLNGPLILPWPQFHILDPITTSAGLPNADIYDHICLHKDPEDAKKSNDLPALGWRFLSPPEPWGPEPTG